MVGKARSFGRTKRQGVIAFAIAAVAVLVFGPHAQANGYPPHFVSYCGSISPASTTVAAGSPTYWTVQLTLSNPQCDPDARSAYNGHIQLLFRAPGTAAYNRIDTLSEESPGCECFEDTYTFPHGHPGSGSLIDVYTCSAYFGCYNSLFDYADVTVVDNPNELAYHGGAILPTSSYHLIFWFANSGNHVPSDESTYVNVLEQYHRDATNLKPFSTVAPQYYENNAAGGVSYVTSTSYYGAVLDTSNYPDGIATAAGSPNSTSCGSSCITDQAIEDEVRKAVGSVSGWSNANGNVYVVFTGRGESVCDNAHGPFGIGTTCSVNGNDGGAICGYHAATSEPITYEAVVYPDTAGSCQLAGATYPNGDAFADSAVFVAAHELAETMTDPFGQGWCDSADYQSIAAVGPQICQGGEVADNCQTYTKEAYGSDSFLVTQLWDNRSAGCSNG